MAFQTAQVGARHPSQYRKILLRDTKAFAPCPLFVYPFDMIQVIPPSVVTFHIFCCAVPKSFKPRRDAVPGTLRRLAIGDLHPPVRYRGPNLGDGRGFAAPAPAVQACACGFRAARRRAAAPLGGAVPLPDRFHSSVYIICLQIENVNIK